MNTSILFLWVFLNKVPLFSRHNWISAPFKCFELKLIYWLTICICLLILRQKARDTWHNNYTYLKHNLKVYMCVCVSLQKHHLYQEHFHGHHMPPSMKLIPSTPTLMNPDIFQAGHWKTTLFPGLHEHKSCYFHPSGWSFPGFHVLSSPLSWRVGRDPLWMALEPSCCLSDSLPLGPSDLLIQTLVFTTWTLSLSWLGQWQVRHTVLQLSGITVLDAVAGSPHCPSTLRDYCPCCLMSSAFWLFFVLSRSNYPVSATPS